MKKSLWYGIIICLFCISAACKKGEEGAPGSQILSGTGVPAATLGAVGDYYLDKSSGALFGPKTADGWGESVSLTGPRGATGATGAAGAAGPAGTANVIYSGWVYASTFVDSIVDNSNVKVGHLKAPSLTADILGSGTVLVYFTFGGGTFVLPYTSYAGNKVSTINYIPGLNKIIITRFTHDNTNTVNLSTVLQYRYILIPGGKEAARMAGSGNVPEYSDYKAVCAYYHLPL